MLRVTVALFTHFVPRLCLSPRRSAFGAKTIRDSVSAPRPSERHVNLILKVRAQFKGQDDEMARSDLLVSLVRAGAAGDRSMLTSTVEALVGRRKNQKSSRPS